MSEKKKGERTITVDEAAAAQDLAETLPIKKRLEEIKGSVSLDAQSFKDLLDRVSADGKVSGFSDGVKYVVTLAENFLVEHEKLPGREALHRAPYTEHIPTWWIATLVEALHYQPPYRDEPSTRGDHAT